MDLARFLGKISANIVAILFHGLTQLDQHLLHRLGRNIVRTAAIALSDARCHNRLLDLGASANRARDSLFLNLLVVGIAIAKPRFENMVFCASKIV